jgi:hypothetical protein
VPEPSLSAAPQIDPEARIPGAWLTIGTFRHFFREEASHSLCERAERGPENPHVRPICQGCRQDLAEYNAELAKPRPRPRLLPAVPQVDHAAMAAKYREAAAAEPNRFRRALQLAEAKAHEIHLKASRSAFEARGVWHG